MEYVEGESHSVSNSGNDQRGRKKRESPALYIVHLQWEPSNASLLSCSSVVMPADGTVKQIVRSVKM